MFRTIFQRTRAFSGGSIGSRAFSHTAHNSAKHTEFWPGHNAHPLTEACKINEELNNKGWRETLYLEYPSKEHHKNYPEHVRLMAEQDREKSAARAETARAKAHCEFTIIPCAFVLALTAYDVWEVYEKRKKKRDEEMRRLGEDEPKKRENEDGPDHSLEEKKNKDWDDYLAYLAQS